MSSRMTSSARRPHPVFATLFAGLLLFVGADCESQNKDSGSTLPTVQMKLGDRTFTLEVADTDANRQYGLMRRNSMPADHGMIFVFAREAPLAFWMRNTRIPLDIIYVNSAGKVVSVKQMKPYDEKTTPSEGPAQYAIELNKGAAEKAGVKAGMTLQLPEGLKSKD
jgi:uncharacterized membrane protein (UPF0127 family)